MKTSVCTIFLFLVCGLVHGQGELRVTKPVAPGFYPPAAHAVRASGEVNVEVLIAPSGKVTSAKAFNGHPLLRLASENAAANWEFSTAAKGSPPRSMILTFRFEIGAITHIEESEKTQETVINKIFPTAFSADVRSETLIPRLLLLPREKGVVRPKTCPLHNEPMLVEIQKATCSSDDTSPLLERSENYNTAEDDEFPNANPEETRDCWENGIERIEVHYCQACRVARSNWMRINS